MQKTLISRRSYGRSTEMALSGGWINLKKCYIPILAIKTLHYIALIEYNGHISSGAVAINNPQLKTIPVEIANEQPGRGITDVRPKLKYCPFLLNNIAEFGPILLPFAFPINRHYRLSVIFRHVIRRRISVLELWIFDYLNYWYRFILSWGWKCFGDKWENMCFLSIFYGQCIGHGLIHREYF